MGRITLTTPRPTILQIIPRLDTGGAERTTVEIAAAIVQAGGRALVATAGGRLAPSVTAAGGEMVTFAAASKNPLRLLTNVAALARLIRSQGVDLLHARSRAPAWSALAAARRTGRPLVTTYHGAYREVGRLKQLYNSVMARGDVVIANSQFTADLIRSRYHTPAQRLRVIHRGVDTAVFDPAAVSTERRERLRAAWGVGSDVPLILHAARLTRWKGQRSAIAALAAARPRLSAVPTLILAGDAQGRDGYRHDLSRDIAAAGLQGHVRLVGHCADMPAAFALATLALSVSQEPEAFGRVAIEAQAMACPVIATRIGGPAEIIAAAPEVASDQATGWLVPVGNAAALADALVGALNTDAPTLAAIGSRARSRVAAHFSLAEMQRQTLAVYDGLLKTDMARAFAS